jgi:hypothetical protein
MSSMGRTRGSVLALLTAPSSSSTFPNYFGSLNGSQPSGFSNVVVSFKRPLPVPFGFDLSATAGAGFPSGSSKISGHGYQPYIQFPWSHRIAESWGVEGMFTLIWFPSESIRNPTFEPTLSVEREFASSTDMFVEYVGDYDHRRPTQLLDALQHPEALR